MFIEMIGQSTNNSLSSLEQPKQAYKCPICGACAFHKHFGSSQPTCKGCSAFFRRCVIFKKSFKCRRNEKCIGTKETNKHGCQSCRFKKCIKAGMQFDALTQLGSQTEFVECSDSSLKKLIQFRNHSFTNRFKALLKVYNGDRSFIGTSGFLKTSTTYERAFQAEFDVCSDYVRCTMIAEGESPQFLHDLICNFMGMWLTVEVLSKNARYNSFNQRRAYFTDDSYQLLNEDIMIGYYTSYNRLTHVDFLAITAMRVLGKVVTVAHKLNEMKITDVEFAFYLYLFLLKEAKRLHPDPRKFDYLYKNLFKDLKSHYDKIYSDTAVCFGNTIMAMDLINDTKHSADELFTIIRLNDFKDSRPDKYNLPNVKPLDFS